MKILYKLWVVTIILTYLFAQYLWFRCIQIFKERKFQQDWIEHNVIIWGLACSKLLRLDCKVYGHDVLSRLKWERNIFLVANHQSYADIPALYVASQKMYGFVAKYELKRIPFLSFWMRVQGCVFINRSKSIQTIKKLRRLEKQGKSCNLAIFPEGTRSKDGQLGPFKPGILRIAWQLDAVLVPVVIKGTRAAWENREKINQDYPVNVRFNTEIDLRVEKKTKKFDQWQKEFYEQYQILHASLN
ncbi:MAG: 1-acyl-sn-glycerol-3-phosphate acyltransferase [Fibrobacteria bacterium]|nr:1-acyl-sn-glycerol-3-phosphate acyltransferase [Fibrobacteria bacterium]